MKNQVVQEWQNMLARGVMPMFEIELKGDEHLLVYLSLADNGLEFSFDSMGLDVRFDGEIITLSNNHYILPFDDYSGLDSMLKMLVGNLNEGFICVNDLYPDYAI